MNIFALIHHKIETVLRDFITQEKLPADLDLSMFVVEPPRDASHGDVSTNVAMVHAKQVKAQFGTPRMFAECLVEALKQLENQSSAEGERIIDTVSVMGPGFINITLLPKTYHAVLEAVLVHGKDFGRGKAQQTPINVEYVSANPTGPMHVGHARGAVFGDALANLLEFAGYPVTREYYINDAGAQVDVLARSAFLRYREALGEDIGAIPDGLYPGDYLVPVGESLAQSHGQTLRAMPEERRLPIVREAAIAAMMAMIKNDLAALNIKHDVFFSERSLVESKTNAVAEAIAVLRAQNLVYEGRLPPPKGQLPEDWEDREQTLFASSQFGDDSDRPLLKSDGGFTYFASDIAYHYNKFTRGFKTMIDVWGADHGGYVKRMQAAVSALSQGTAHLEVRLCQLVRLMRHGEPVKMSKRAGDFVTLREVVDEVGRDATRFMMLFRKNDATLDFDLAKVIEQSKDNPVFYVQYAHARACSVVKQALTAFPDLKDFAGARKAAQEAALNLLDDTHEIALIAKLAQYPRQIEAASRAFEPHRIAFYLHELATLFHAHWNFGKDQPQLRFIKQTERNISLARLALVFGVMEIVSTGLDLLGVHAPEEMR